MNIINELKAARAASTTTVRSAGSVRFDSIAPEVQGEERTREILRRQLEAMNPAAAEMNQWELALKIDQWKLRFEASCRCEICKGTNWKRMERGESAQALFWAGAALRLAPSARLVEAVKEAQELQGELAALLAETREMSVVLASEHGGLMLYLQKRLADMKADYECGFTGNGAEPVRASIRMSPATLAALARAVSRELEHLGAQTGVTAHGAAVYRARLRAYSFLRAAQGQSTADEIMLAATTPRSFN
jgi:hypothetical protein